MPTPRMHRTVSFLLNQILSIATVTALLKCAVPTVSQTHLDDFQISPTLLDQAQSTPLPPWKEGEILQVANPYLVFFAGEMAISPGEILHTDGSEVRVTGTQGKLVVAEIHFKHNWLPHVGGLVELRPKETGAYQLAFFTGLNQSKKVGGFGGTHPNLGLNFAWSFPNNLEAVLHLQADWQGSNSSDIQHRVASYMLGIGTKRSFMHAYAMVGSRDTMTIHPGSYVNPVTGDSTGVEHQDQGAYMLGLETDFVILPIDRNHPCSLNAGTWASYSNTFSKNETGAIKSLGLLIKTTCGFR